MKQPKKGTQIFLLIIIILLFICLGIPIGVTIGYWRQLPSLASLEYENKSWKFPSKVYSDIARISPQMSYANLVKRLDRLNYQPVDNEQLNKGEY
ncbi:TPA: hypothetical protein ENS27_05085, partial [bacterium]|nr:hypothetical protein [bacterium]